MLARHMEATSEVVVSAGRRILMKRSSYGLFLLAAEIILPRGVSCAASFYTRKSWHVAFQKVPG